MWMARVTQLCVNELSFEQLALRCVNVTLLEPDLVCPPPAAGPRAAAAVCVAPLARRAGTTEPACAK